LIPPGTYADTYTAGTQSSISIDNSPTGNPTLECTGASGTHWWVTTGFTVSVTLAPSCAVSASPLGFGAVGLLTGNADATTNLSVTCTYTTPYSVSLSAGNAPGATTSTRAMTNGSAEVYYFLYQDAAHSQNWGSNLGVDTVAGVGTGSAQSLSVYGRVPPQTTPTIGNYSDTIVVTVNY
jgi:spore coat protein U-like protein